MKNHTGCWIPLAVALTALFSAPQARSEGQHELLLFLSGGPTYHQVTPDDGLESYDVELDADAVYSYLNGRFRLLGEFIASTEETELERFQLGWQAGEETVGWLGRFHSPGRYWNSKYHHGHYLQTSITRPLIEQFEDDGGILPTHSTGFMLDTAQALDGAADIQAVFSLGTAPVIGSHELEPYDLLDPDSDSKAAANIRLAYLPDQLGENQAGLVFSAAGLKVDGNHTAEQQGLQRVDQYAMGVYLDWRLQDWRFISNLASIVNRMKRRARNQADSFLSGYFQTEYEFRQDWILFGRLEATSDTNRSDYLQLFPNSVTDRQMLGLRFDFLQNNALTIEVSHAETVSDDFGQALLQWSAVFP